jgi:hypothetical protein
MGKIGKISVIKKDFNGSQLQTMEGGLSQRGMTRVPGTGVFKFPYKELDGQYRTGLDENAAYIRRIQDPTEQKLEKKRVSELRKKLEMELGGIDLGSRSSFWNYGLASSPNDTAHVQPIKLMDGDNLFDLTIPFKELSFAWLRVHPTIASSYSAWERGEYPADTQFYVSDEDVESLIVFNKKLAINKAIAKFDSMSPSKKLKVARLLGLPVSDDTKAEVIYNLVDNTLKDLQFKSGKNQGRSTIDEFNRFADMKDNLLHVKDLIKQAISHSIYRLKPNGHITEGEFEIATSEEELVMKLVDVDNQDQLLMLESQLKTKKLASQ